ncbi:MAG TPA: hypothetical protein VLH16_00170 [Bacteroidales bacterium]|nr:hypothetical protein [Bacteroidales bacterium]
MKTLSYFPATLLATLILLAVVSCQKQNDDELIQDDGNDYVLAESVFNDVNNIIDQAMDFDWPTGLKGDLSGHRPNLAPCAVITRDTISIPPRIIIDFGPENCLCNDGNYRRGRIIISFTGRFWQAGTVITTTLEDYYVNDNHVQGTKVVTNNGLNNAGNMYWTIIADGSVTRANNAGVVTWQSEREREWVEGMDTPRFHRDDVFLIRGSSVTTRPDGTTLTSTITTDLRKPIACRWIVSGTVEIVPSNRPTRILDYGDGACDRIATITVGDRTRTIRLP